LWWNNATSNYITGLHAGTYTLAVTDQNNCKQNSSFTVDDTCTSITVRTGVSPNGDGINDTWIIDGIQDYPKNKVQVFDKWGDMVYEKENYNNDWGGRSIKGELVPDGTYYYLVKLNAPNAPEGNEVFKGALLIKR
jgi:gliding motility-associated-like protein